MNDGFPALIYRRYKDPRWLLTVQVQPVKKEYKVNYNHIVPADHNMKTLGSVRTALNAVLKGKIVRVKCKRAFAVSEVLEVYDDWKTLEVK